MGIIKGICISKERGTEKHEVAEAGFVKDWGIQGDAHAGKCTDRSVCFPLKK